MNTQRRFTLAILCILAAIILLTIATQFALNDAQRTRGIERGFPQPIQPYLATRPALGVNVALEQYDDAQLASTLNKIESAGFTWLRQTFAWANIEPEQSQFDWSTTDRILNAIDNTSLDLIAVLDTSPDWSRSPSNLQSPVSNLQSPISNLHLPISNFQFASFARAFAQRYGERIDTYQIWDEPNLGAHWNGFVNPIAYAEMLRESAAAIRQADPQARIILAGLAPTVETTNENMADWLFLRQLYDAGAQDAFDVVSAKPYGFDSGPDDRRIDPNLLNFSHIILLRDEMLAHGDGDKAIWATQFGWNTHPASIWGLTSEEQRASNTIGAIQRARDEWPWIGVMALENWQPNAPIDDPHWGFALLDPSGAPRPVIDAISRITNQQDIASSGYHPAAVPAQPRSSAYVANPFATFEGEWAFGELGADWSERGGKVTINFQGKSIALHVRRAADRANLYISIDGQPANALPQDAQGRAFMQLIPPQRLSTDVSLIPIATGLSDGRHRVEIVTERGWNQWSLIGWSIAHETSGDSADALPGILIVLAFAFAYGALRNLSRIQWGAFGRRLSAVYTRLSNTAQIAITAVTALIFYASIWLNWGADIAAAYRRLGDPANILLTLAATGFLTFSPWTIVAFFSGIALAVLILLRLDLGLMLVAFFAPFFLLPANLFYNFSSMVELTLMMCVAGWGLRKIYRWRSHVHVSSVEVSRATHLTSSFSMIDWGVLALFIISTLSLFSAQYFEFALREWRVILFEPMLYYLLLRSIKPDATAIRRIVDALILAGVLIAVIGLVQYAFNLNLITAEEGTRRLRSIYGSPNNVGLFLGRVLPIGLALALFDNGRKRIVYALALIPIALAIILSQSRGAILLGIPAAILAIGVLAGGRWLWASIGALALGAIASIPLLNSPRIQALFSGEGTAIFRLSLWRSSVHMIREHPLFGVGPDNFLYAYRNRYLLPEAWEESGLSHPHNVLLDFGARLGLLGLAAFLWLQIGFWKIALPLRRSADRYTRALAIGLMASMIDFLAHGMVDAAYFVVDLAFVFMLTLALIQLLVPHSSSVVE